MSKKTPERQALDAAGVPGLELLLLERIAISLERIADAQEAAHPGTSFRTRYKSDASVEGDLLDQDDAELAEIEKRDRERGRASGGVLTDDEVMEIGATKR